MTSLIAKRTKNSREASLIKRGEKMALQLFRDAAQRVPAYKDFLAKEGINPAKIRTLADFASVPPVHKKNYLMQYSLHDLSWDGNLFNSRLISVSSGSSGVPFFWPRGVQQDEEATDFYEDIYRHIFEVDKYSTLFVVCFSMGTWIAGSYTTAGTLNVWERGYNLNVVTPGIEMEDALKAIRSLGGLYDQIVLVGYPPFIKDLVDLGPKHDIDWKKHRVRFLFAGEAFSEGWRSHLVEKVGAPNEAYYSCNIFGSADAGILGYETPVSVTLRRLYDKKPEVTERLFGTPILPSIEQYYPDRRYFQSVDGELVFTCNTGIPLVRYNIRDTGGVIGLDSAIDPVADEFKQQAKKLDLDLDHWSLPLVYLNGRRDFTATIYAVNIYPENIKAALEDHQLRDWATGKFTMATKYHSDMDQYFEINLELQADQKPTKALQKQATDVIVATLSKLNAEFRKLYAAVGDKAVPHVNLIDFGDKDYFSRGIKHRWKQ